MTITFCQAVKTFFRTNKNTCQEWLSRIRIFLLKISLHCGMYTSVVRHASEILHEMKELDNTKVSCFICLLLSS